MQEIKRILERRFKGESQRSIASSLHLSRNTVSKVFKAADQTGLSWVQFQTMDEVSLEKLLFPEKEYIPVQKLPDFEYVHKELLKAGTTLKGLWEEYVMSCKDAKLPYYHRTQFNKLYHDHVRKHRLTMHISHKPGDRVMVDWAGTTMNVHDHLTGEVTKAYLFVATLPFSMYCYVYACKSMKQEDWIQCHIQMYRYFDGVTRILVPDNLKTGVIRNRRHEDPIINKAYQEMADHYDTSIIPARVKKPRDKAAVEGTVGNVTNYIIGRLRNRQFFSFSSLNKAVAIELDRFNSNPFQKREGCRKSVYESEEKEFMMPLPPEPFELSEWKTATVQINCHISVSKMNYSVPYEYVGKRVEVRQTNSIVEVYYKGTRICSHVRLHGRANQYSTNNDHMPENHKLFEWNKDKFEKWAKETGEHTYEVIHRLISKYRVEEQAYKSCISLLKLSDKYSSERLENACKLALEHITQPSFKNIRLILESGQDIEHKNSKTEKQIEVDIKHAYVRGEDYYGGKKQ